MAWWPNVDTQVNYLNYMSKVFNLDAKYSSTDKQENFESCCWDIQIKIEQKIQAENQHNGCVKLSLPLLRHNHNGTKKLKTTLKVAAKITFKVVPFFYVNDSRTPWANSDYRRFEPYSN